jgi:hypothetical protein
MFVHVAEDDSRAYVTSNDNRINLELVLVYRATFSDCKESGMLAYQYNRCEICSKIGYESDTCTEQPMSQVSCTLGQNSTVLNKIRIK